MLQAWHEVDNALTAYQTEQARRDQLIQAVAQNQRALGLAQSRYQEGVADFLQVLTAQQNLLSTQQQLALTTTNVSANLVALYKALGGGWETQMPAANDDLSPIGAPICRPALTDRRSRRHGRTPWRSTFRSAGCASSPRWPSAPPATRSASRVAVAVSPRAFPATMPRPASPSSRARGPS